MLAIEEMLGHSWHRQLASNSAPSRCSINTRNKPVWSYWLGVQAAQVNPRGVCVWEGVSRPQANNLDL